MSNFQGKQKVQYFGLSILPSFLFSKNFCKTLIDISSEHFLKSLSMMYLKLKCNWYHTFYLNDDGLPWKKVQFLVKIGSYLAKNWSIFLAISRTAFLARNVSQNHFSFSREMREMCMSSAGTFLHFIQYSCQIFQRDVATLLM